MAKSIGLSEYFVFVDEIAEHLRPDFLRCVEDIEYGEWETSFEAILLELMKLPSQNVSLDLSMVESLAAEAGIVDDGVLDPNTWQKFRVWTARKSKNPSSLES